MVREESKEMQPHDTMSDISQRTNPPSPPKKIWSSVNLRPKTDWLAGCELGQTFASSVHHYSSPRHHQGMDVTETQLWATTPNETKRKVWMWQKSNRTNTQLNEEEHSDKLKERMNERRDQKAATGSSQCLCNPGGSVDNATSSALGLSYPIPSQALQAPPKTPHPRPQSARTHHASHSSATGSRRGPIWSGIGWWRVIFYFICAPQPPRWRTIHQNQR